MGIAQTNKLSPQKHQIYGSLPAHVIGVTASTGVAAMGAACKRSRASTQHPSGGQHISPPDAQGQHEQPMPLSKHPRTSAAAGIHAASPNGGIFAVAAALSQRPGAATVSGAAGSATPAPKTTQLPSISTLHTALSMTDSVMRVGTAATATPSRPSGLHEHEAVAENTEHASGNQDAGISPFALEAAQAQFHACSAHDAAPLSKRTAASGLESDVTVGAAAAADQAAPGNGAAPEPQPTRTRSKRRAALRAVMRLGAVEEGGVTPPLHAAAVCDEPTCPGGDEKGDIAAVAEASIPVQEMTPSYWRKHIFVKLLFVSSRAISNQLVSGRSQIGWAVILPAKDALQSLSYRQRSELVRCNGSKVAIRYLLASHEKETVKGETRQGQLRGGKQFMAMTAAWFDVIDVEAIVAAGTDLFALHPAATAGAGYPMFECLTA